MRATDANLNNTDDGDAASQSVWRLFPGPHTASEQAAIAASLEASRPKRRLTRGRILAGAAALTVALTVPDLSVGAVTSPYLRIDVREPSPILQQPIWSPAVSATAPVYAPVMAAKEIAPDALTVTTRTRFVDDDRLQPLGFLETGTEQFDLAFAGVEMPTPVRFTVAPVLPDQPAGEIRSITSPIRTRTIDVPQITGVARIVPAQVARRPQRQLTANSNVARSAAVANESVAAAFAGTLDVSSDLRGSLPISAVRQPAVPPLRETQPSQPQPSQPQPNEPARAVPIPVPETPASGRDIQTELVTKTRLDARINGVVAGHVDFRQLDGTIALRLGSVVDMLRNRYPSSELDSLRGSGALDSFVTLAQLQSAGIPISYDPVYDEIEFGIDYNDAPQAVKVQVEQIGPPTFTSDAALIDQIPR